MWKLIFSFSLLLILTGCHRKPNIERAEYLEKIFPKSDKAKTFLVKYNYFNKPSCQYLENWALVNIQPKDKNIYEQYTFLTYSDTITLKNPYIEKDYDAIVGDYEICLMSSRDYKCFICKD